MVHSGGVLCTPVGTAHIRPFQKVARLNKKALEAPWSVVYVLYEETMVGGCCLAVRQRIRTRDVTLCGYTGMGNTEKKIEYRSTPTRYSSAAEVARWQGGLVDAIHY